MAAGPRPPQSGPGATPGPLRACSPRVHGRGCASSNRTGVLLETGGPDGPRSRDRRKNGNRYPHTPHPDRPPQRRSPPLERRLIEGEKPCLPPARTASPPGTRSPSPAQTTRSSRSSAWTGWRTPTRLPFSLKVLLENLIRTEDGANITADHIRALANWDPARRTEHRDPVHPGAGDHAGLHRRALRRRPGHHARGDGRPRRRPGQDQPAGAGRDGHRPLGDRRRVRPRGCVRAQRGARVRAQSRAVPVPALGADRVRRVQGGAAGHRDRAPGQHRAPGPGRDVARDGLRPTRTPASAPTRTPPWSTAWAYSAGASAASRPRRPCSASRCRCSSRGSSGSS